MTFAFLQVRAPRAPRRRSGQNLWRPASSLIQSFTCMCFLFSPSPSSVNNHKIHCSRKANYYTKGWFWRFIFGCISFKLIISQKLEECIYIYIYICTYSCSLCCTAETQHCKTIVFQLKKKNKTARSPCSHSWSHPRASHQPRVSESPHQWFMPLHHCKLNKFFPR